MVATLASAKENQALGDKASPVIEVVGPAGAGKTTLVGALANCNRGIHVLDLPFYRELKEFQFFVRNTLALLPAFFNLRFNQDGQPPTRRHFAWMAILNGWSGRLQRIRDTQAITVLDQGPVFLMVQMLYFERECFRMKKMENWWDGMIKKWAATLGEIFFLDAADDQLLKRIRERSKWHVMKEEPESAVFEFLDKYRFAYERLISKLAANNHNLKVVYFDTGRTSTDGMVKRILDEYHLKDERV